MNAIFYFLDSFFFACLTLLGLYFMQKTHKNTEMQNFIPHLRLGGGAQQSGLRSPPHDIHTPQFESHCSLAMVLRFVLAQQHQCNLQAC